MIAKLKIAIMSLLTVGVLAVPAMASAVTSNNITTNTCTGVQTATGSAAQCNNPGGTQTTVNNIITTVINIFSIVVGAVSVVMIIFGGFRYITSGGDSTKVNSSKNTILYAVIGLVVVALAQFIVQFVLTKSQGV